jgi:hypothetical protein
MRSYRIHARSSVELSFPHSHLKMLSVRPSFGLVMRTMSSAVARQWRHRMPSRSDSNDFVRETVMEWSLSLGKTHQGAARIGASGWPGKGLARNGGFLTADWLLKTWLLRTDVGQATGTDRGIPSSFGMKIRGKHFSTTLLAVAAISALLAASAAAVHQPIRSFGKKASIPGADQRPVRVVGTPFVPNINPRER